MLDAPAVIDGRGLVYRVEGEHWWGGTPSITHD